MTIAPTQNYLLVRMRDMRDSTFSIVLPDSSSPTQPYGEVIACGPDCMTTSPGDHILFLPSNLIAGFNEGADEQFIIHETCIFAKLHEEPALLV